MSEYTNEKTSHVGGTSGASSGVSTDGEVNHQENISTGNGAKQAGNAAEHPAVGFLEHLRPGGPWVLLAFLPDPAPPDPFIITITAHSASGVTEFVSKHNGTRNLYYQINPTRTDVFKKTIKTDIDAIEYIQADLDPKTGETIRRCQKTFPRSFRNVQPQAHNDNGYWQRHPVPVAKG